jgi:hypothetical protein
MSFPRLLLSSDAGYRISGDDAMALLYSLNRTREREEALMALFSKLSHRCGHTKILLPALLYTLQVIVVVS